MQELPSCPAELNGGFQIMQLFNGKTDERCFFNNDNGYSHIRVGLLGNGGSYCTTTTTEKLLLEE